MYMSYCRFEGALSELRACLNEVEDHMSGSAPYAVSDEEIFHFETMIEEFVGWMHDMCLLNDEGDIDTDELKSLTELMRKGYKEESEEW